MTHLCEVSSYLLLFGILVEIRVYILDALSNKTPIMHNTEQDVNENGSTESIFSRNR